MSTIVLFPLVDQRKWSEAEEDQEKNDLRHQEGSDGHSRWTRNSSFRGSITEEEVADYPLAAVGQTHEKSEQESSQTSSTHPEEGKKRGLVNPSLNNFLDVQEKGSTSTENTRSTTPDNDRAVQANHSDLKQAENSPKAASPHKDVQEGSPVTAV